MRVRTALLAVLALPALVALPACGDDDPPSGDAGGPDEEVTTTTTVADDDGEVAEVTIYLERDEALAAVHREVGMEGDAVLESALLSLLKGPTADEMAAGFGTEIPATPDGTGLNDVSIADGTATVDLTSEFETGGGSASMLMRVAQVTHTATQFPTVDDVRYRIDGTDVISIGGEGVSVDPSTRADFEAVLPAIFVDLPAEGATVGEEFEVTGTSNTFEATHQIELLNAEGDPFLEDHVTATSGSGTRGDWTYPARIPVGVTGGITLRVYEISAEDGSEVNEVTVALAVEDAADDD